MGYGFHRHMYHACKSHMHLASDCCWSGWGFWLNNARRHTASKRTRQMVRFRLPSLFRCQRGAARLLLFPTSFARTLLIKDERNFALSHRHREMRPISSERTQNYIIFIFPTPAHWPRVAQECHRNEMTLGSLTTAARAHTIRM